jgi:electron transfer flavoprotein beta subunit
MVTDPKTEGSDAYATAKILAAAVKNIPYNIILTGALADDDGYAQVGASLAELLGIPHATLVTNMEIGDKRVKIKRELEGGMEEALDVETPAVFTIQSGINEPRYVSIMGIRKVAKKEIGKKDLGAIGLAPDQAGAAGSFIAVEKIFTPPVGEGAQMLQGSPDEVATKVTDIFQKGGVI